MELPKYIVMKVDCEPKSTTVTITDISDRCDVIEYEAEQTEPSIRKFSPDIESGFIRPQTEPQTDCLTCRYNSDEWDSPKCDGCSKAHSNYEPQTEREGE